jgi:hypothetical protein
LKKIGKSDKRKLPQRPIVKMQPQLRFKTGEGIFKMRGFKLA